MDLFQDKYPDIKICNSHTSPGFLEKKTYKKKREFMLRLSYR